MKKKQSFNIIYTSIMVSFAVVIELLFKFVIILQMPLGGGVSLAMLPLAVAAAVCGWKYGLAGGIIYGLLDCFLIDGYSFNLASFILDYILAFGGIAIIGLFKDKILSGKRKYFVLGFVLALIFRWICSSFSGIINAGVWGYDSAFLEGIFGVGKGATIYLYIYSFIYYNLPYIVASGALCIAVGLLIYKVIFLREYFGDNTQMVKEKEESQGNVSDETENKEDNK